MFTDFKFSSMVDLYKTKVQYKVFMNPQFQTIFCPKPRGITKVLSRVYLRFSSGTAHFTVLDKFSKIKTRPGVERKTEQSKFKNSEKRLKPRGVAKLFKTMEIYQDPEVKKPYVLYNPTLEYGEF